MEKTGRAKAGHRGDQTVPQVENVESVGDEGISIRVEGVAGHSKLAVRAGRHVAPTLRKDRATEVSFDSVVALQPRGLWRHRPGGVFAEQGEERGNVALLDGRRILGRKLAPLSVTKSAE